MSRPVRIIAVGAVTAVLCAALVLVARRAADAPATSDTAVIESYTLMAARGTLELGAYSRFQWHHPGPLYLYLLTPWYIAGAHKNVALNAGAAAIALACAALIIGILLRRSRMLAVCGSACLALYAVRAAEAMTSPWNPHVPVLVTAALLVAAADVIAGNMFLLPVVALLASVAAQAHVALVPCVISVAALPTIRAGGAALSSVGSKVRWRAALVATALVVAAAWALPIHEQFTGLPRGNGSELWNFFVRMPRGRQSLAAAVSAWSDMLVGVLRPDFGVAHGLPFIESPVRWAEWLSIAQLIALTAFCYLGVRRKKPFDAALAGVLIVASLISLWSATRIEDRIFDHDVFWMVAIGLLNLTVLLTVASSAFARDGGMPGGIAIGATAALSVVIAVATFQRLEQRVRGSYGPPPDAQRARALSDDLKAYIRDHSIARPLVKIDQDAWEVTAGAILALQKDGRLVSVEDDWVVMFTPLFRATGREDAVVTVAAPAEHLRLLDRGQPLISAHEPIYAHLSAAESPARPSP